jgi:hypothetical protein
MREPAPIVEELERHAELAAGLERVLRLRHRRLEVGAGDGDRAWLPEIGSTSVTGHLGAVGHMLPAALGGLVRGSPRFAGMSLRAGPVRLAGLATDGRRFAGERADHRHRRNGQPRERRGEPPRGDAARAGRARGRRDSTAGAFVIGRA